MSDQATHVGLYDPADERDACGVGVVCRTSGEASHEIVQQALHVLFNLEHRGACGCDPRTGDGAGILVQLPHRFLSERLLEDGVHLPEPGDYGIGMLYLPRSKPGREECRAAVERAVAEQGQSVLAWRRVETDDGTLGIASGATEPEVWQVVIRRGSATPFGLAFERRLFVIRRVLESGIGRRYSTAPDVFYASSLSSRTIVYKGMLTTDQLPLYFPDLSDPHFESALAMVHSRFSTNTLPRWPLAQPFRYLCHNGEINTLRGNVNWMRSREPLLKSDLFGADMQKLLPLLTEGGSDSQILDNALELLTLSGRSLPQAIMTLIPEAWQRSETIDPDRRAFYEYTACMMEPWDGPATVPFTDGRYVGALLDRNGLRPSRYVVTYDGLVVLSSEAGVLDISPSDVREKGRLQPGRMLLVDLQEKSLVTDEEIKQRVSRSKPYRTWIAGHMRHLTELPEGDVSTRIRGEQLERYQRMFGYTLEDAKVVLSPMAGDGKEATASMGNDTPLAVLSDRPRLLYDYFKQLFAQVTNPPLDAIREELVTSLLTNLGARRNLLQETPRHARQVRCERPILSTSEAARIRSLQDDGLAACEIPALFPVGDGERGLARALDELCSRATEAVDSGCGILYLTDRGGSRESAPIPALLATSAVHHHLIRQGRRARCSIVVESGEPREVHHFCLLLGFGAEAVHPYLALDSVASMAGRDSLVELDEQSAALNYVRAACKGILKVMSKMGISTVQSYRGAQIFEAVGIGGDVVDRYFSGVPSRIGGVGLDVIAAEARMRHQQAFPPRNVARVLPLDVGGMFQWRRTGEYHLFNPHTVARLQHAVRSNAREEYAEYARLVNEQTSRLGTIRGLLELDESATAVPLDEVEPWTEIVKRFKTGAMSYGSISQESHEALAVAMNRIGGRSNTGEGGEQPERYSRDSERRSRIKQVASGRFGVTIDYLASADEIQIKMAQGAKPGEGGQLPGQKVYPWIAETRHSTPYVGLISPPPHHDIYSIEDLAQLIFDLKNANPGARISVKLVSEVGVGTIAAGVAKGKADVVLISGHDGGTGASPATSVMHAGLPWELGLSETHQALVVNGLRSRIKVECDGQLKTGRDVAIAALLGADEFGFATAPLVSLGCIMMRKCHLNTCPVGIATQDPQLRARFSGEPEHVINFFYFVASELRELMARLGFRSIEEMVGRVDRLRQRSDVDHWKARYLDLAPVLTVPEVPDALKPFAVAEQDHVLDDVLDRWLVSEAEGALKGESPVVIETDVSNLNRALGTMLSHEVSRRLEGERLDDDSITIRGRGSVGQSCGAFAAAGVTIHIVGEANDYFGKGLSGGKLIVTPPPNAGYIPNMNIIVGNVALYGATSGKVFLRGQAGERFAVRNSGACAVVEGVGDHACEYMTGGTVVILGPTGRNFAAGMSGGIAYVMDGTREFRDGRCNSEMVELLDVTDPDDVAELFQLIEEHVRYTGSDVARWVVEHWSEALPQFVKVLPHEYRLALERLAAERSEASAQPVAA